MSKESSELFALSRTLSYAGEPKKTLYKRIKISDECYAKKLRCQKYCIPIYIYV